MSGFRLTRFAGTAPKVPARKLPAHLAQTAENCDLRNGDLLALNGPSFVETPSKVGTKQSIYEWGNGVWFHWLTDVDVVRAPIAGDTTERTAYTGDGVPKVTDSTLATASGTDYPTNSYRLGVPQPTSAPTVVIGNAECNPADQISVAFAYRCVNSWGEVGPLLGGSGARDLCEGQSFTLDSLVTPSGNYNITAKRIYAFVDAGWQYLDEIDAAAQSVTLTWDSEALGEVIEGEDWYEPPDDMQGLCMGPNGMAMGFAGNEIIPSERWLVHAYPPSYRLTTDYPIVGLKPAGASFIVTTTGNPYLVQGIDPASLSLIKLESQQACVSKRSMVDMGYSVMYASPDGLIAVSEGGAVRNMTEGAVRREDWQAINPSSILGAYWEGKYLGFYDTGAIQGGFIIDPEVEGIVWHDIHASAAHNVLEEDALYLQVGDDIVQWNAGSAKTYTWRSKELVAERPLNMGAAQVKAASYPLTLKVYADGVLKHTQSVTNANPFRLPAGFLAETWELEITGTVQVHEAVIAETIQELRAV